jgi:hypothetical protein
MVPKQKERWRHQESQLALESPTALCALYVWGGGGVADVAVTIKTLLKGPSSET